MMRLAPPCRATRHPSLRRETWGCSKKFASPQLVQWSSRSPAKVRKLQGGGNLKVGEAQRGLERYGGEPDRPSLEETSMTAFACSGVSTRVRRHLI
jgi:hypothetical protein